MSTPQSEIEMKSVRYSGRVKWFNNGYGFITMNEKNDAIKHSEKQEENDNEEYNVQQTKDIFVHHNSIYVETNQYKYLVQGEYVEFDIAPAEKEGLKYDFQAKNVTGINGGKLLCETRREYNLEQNKYKQGETTEGVETSSKSYYSRQQGRGFSSIRGRGRGRGMGFGRGYN
jgi:cold shock CspA family protein